MAKLQRQFGCDTTDATDDQLYQALAMTVRDEVMERRAASRGERKRQRAKKLYYLSAEFLVGRTMHNNMVSLVNEKEYMQALDELGIDKTRIFEREPEPGLGNGGLGRLAACFLDSLSSLKLPARSAARTSPSRCASTATSRTMSTRTARSNTACATTTPWRPCPTTSPCWATTATW